MAANMSTHKIEASQYTRGRSPLENLIGCTSQTNKSRYPRFCLRNQMFAELQADIGKLGCRGS